MRNSSSLGQIFVHTAFDYETTPHLLFEVTATTTVNRGKNNRHTITRKTKVEITVTDIDDNCPVFTSPSYTEVTLSSPVVADGIVTHVTYKDADVDKNNVLDILDISSGAFKIDQDGIIRTRRLLSTLVDEFYNTTVTVRSSRCSDTVYVGVRLKACIDPSTYMFTSNGRYEVAVDENTPVGASVLTVAINGAYSRSFSIVESTANQDFQIDSSTGNYLS